MTQAAYSSISHERSPTVLFLAYRDEVGVR
jgi:hypothetical protein